MKKIIILSALLILMVGCVKYVKLTVLSDPQGCKVLINDDLVGVTPTSVDLKFTRSLSWYEPFSVDVEVYPSGPGQYLQRKLLWSSDIIKKGAMTLYFDMYLGRAPLKYEFDIKNK